MVLLLRERDARRVDRGSCRDHSECETPINHELVPFGKWLCADNVVRISRKRCDQVSFVICTEPMMNGLTTDKSQRFRIKCESRGHLQSPWHRSRRPAKQDFITTPQHQD